jgi:diguanylate cyclase (GGDEF)-like protein
VSLTTVLIALALAATLTALVAAVTASLRLRGTLDDRVAAAARQIAEEWASRPELAASLDPEELIAHALAEVEALPGVDAALIVLGTGGQRRTLARGLSEEEADRIALEAPQSTNLRALEVVYRYRLDDVGGVSSRPRAGLVVPLRAGDQALGSLAALSRSSSARFFDGAVDALEGIGRRAGPALVTARRFAEARQLAELDSLTGLYNRRAFHNALEREVARARRYDRRLALVVLDVDDFKHVNDAAGHLVGDAVLSEVGRRIRSLVRATDIPCRFGGDEFAIILPESSRGDGELLANRVVGAIASAKVDRAGSLRASAGVAELEAEDTGLGLFERADLALYRAKDAGKARTAAG